MTIPRCPGCGATYGEGLVDDNMMEWCNRCNYSWHLDSGITNRGGDPVKIKEYDDEKSNQRRRE